MARRGSLAKIGVVVLAPIALGIAILGLVVGTRGFSLLQEHGPTQVHSDPTTSWMVICFVVAGLVFVGWVACIVHVLATRERDDDPIPPARTVERR